MIGSLDWKNDVNKCKYNENYTKFYFKRIAKRRNSLSHPKHSISTQNTKRQKNKRMNQNNESSPLFTTG